MIKVIQLILIVFPLVSLAEYPTNLQARWDTPNDRMLVRFDLNSEKRCLIIRYEKIERVQEQWTDFEVADSQEQNPCHDLKWVVAKNRDYPERPTKELINNILKYTGSRITVGDPCYGEPVEISSRGQWMLVRDNEYALCVVTEEK